ncbi:MAG: UvrD-helicase domain-containing protein [Oscillospiraceae bacterium]|jgi:DNA helicase-2/ATP-dependent DNA helicase PcrA|nr:UvrD-helicase domain-containing protein [Oscillospiraceae bacterium]
MDLSMLNPEQRLAAETTEGPLLILAGAGSGKTRALTYRIANLLAGGVSAREILAITFTNKAAREMRDRLTQLTDSKADDVWVFTFHACCACILRRDIEKLGYTRAFTIYDDDDQMALIKEQLKKLNIDDKLLPPREVKGRISDAKNRLQSPDEWFAASSRDYRMQMIHDVYRRYEERLRSLNALDFDDLLVKTLELFAAHPPVLEAYQRRFHYIHVDEYQDTNYAQYMFVKLLAAHHRNLCVVGDDDQSIYGWRGADIRNILDFEKDFSGCTTIKLEQNYRSTANILDAANSVIAHNVGRKAKALWTEQGEGSRIRLFKAGDEREEGAWICDRVRQLRQGGVGYGDMAVLYRINAQSRVLEEMMVRAGIPYSVYGGTRFYDRKEVRDAVAYLRVIVNPADDVSLRRVINQPKRAIGEATIAELVRHAEEQGYSVFTAMLEPPDTLASRARKCVGDFAALLAELTLRRRNMGLVDFVTLLLNETGLLAQYENDRSDEAQARLENLREFVGAVAEFEQRAEEPTLEAFLENVALVTDLDNLSGKSQNVTLMTLHSAKGLEFPVVFIIGLEEGIFTRGRSLFDPEKLEEERRLCYVGITRAREQLYLSHAVQRMLFNQLQHNPPSPFLAEVPTHLLDESGTARMERAFPAAPERAREPAKAPRPLMKDFSGGRAGALRIPGVQKGFGPDVTVPSLARRQAAPTLFAAGDRVLHRKFGEGNVTAIMGTGADARIRIEFAAYGVKEFSVSIAPIVKVGV